jgi:hypothetical protein
MSIRRQLSGALADVQYCPDAGIGLVLLRS